MKKITLNLVMAMLWPKRTQIKPKILFYFIIGFCLFPSFKLFAQSNAIRITGTIISSDDKKPLPGATIHIKAVDNQAVSDQNGDFQILAADSSGMLQISFIGYRTATVLFSRNNRGPFRILMDQDASVLKEVVVSTGYQTLPKERATGSFAQVDNQLLNRRVSTDLLSKLEG